MLLSNKKEYSLDTHNNLPGWIPRELCGVKKANPKRLQLQDSVYTTVFKWQNYRNKKHWLPGVKESRAGGGCGY